MKYLRGYAVVLGSLLLQDGAHHLLLPVAHAQNCGTTTIRTAQDAEALTSKCPVIHGNLTIQSTQDIPAFLNLTGIEVIEGTLETDCGRIPGPPGTPPDFGPCKDMFNKTDSVKTTIEALTLRAVQGGVMLSGRLSLKNFTAPRLGSVGGWFYVQGSTLEYLNVEDLEEVGWLSMMNSGVSEFVHRGLKRVTGGKAGTRGGKREISIYGLPKLRNLDSILAGPAEVDKLGFDQATTDMTAVTIGAARAGEVTINGMGNLAVTFGTEDTEGMALGRVEIRGLSAVRKAEAAKNVTVEVFDVQHNEFERLDIPFHDMGTLYMMYEKKLRTLTLPPEAKEYTNLTVAIWDCENLDLTSEFVKDKEGKKVKGWYWPQRDMGRIAIYNTSVDEALFNSLIEYRMAIQDPTKRPKIKSIDLWPPAKEKDDLDCTSLQRLDEAGVIEEHVVCDGFSDSSAAPVLLASASRVLMAVVLGCAMFMALDV